MNVLAFDENYMPFGLPKGPNINKIVSEQIDENQPPLGSQFKSYELTQAVNYYTLDPFQYNITKFDYNSQTNPKNNTGLIYKDVDFEKLLPAFTATKKSVNDFPAQSYHRFQANEGYFNPKESTDNSDLWYYGSSNNARTNGIGIAGAALNLQEPKHIIFPEAQRGGTDSRNLTKYSWSNFTQPSDIKTNNENNCQFFNYNTGYTTTKQPSVYRFDSGYCRNIGISGPYEGSMPFNPDKIY
jgi:hypothetical protein